MKIKTEKFGEIEINNDRIFEFELPIIGFNDLKRYVILDLNKDGIFKWLQSIDDEKLAFPIVSVFNMNLDYSIDIPDNIVDILNITSVENVLVMNIASIPQDNPQGTTINLLAPLVFNIENQKAGQIILSGSGYNVSFPLFKVNK